MPLVFLIAFCLGCGKDQLRDQFPAIKVGVEV